MNAPNQPRQPRCRLLDRLQNRCPNPAVSDFGLCWHHLSEAAGEYAAVKADALRQARLKGGEQ